MYRTSEHTIASRPDPQVTVRMAMDSDAGPLGRLAALDSAEAPTGPTVVAEVAGELVAALPVRGGGPIADPFRRTAAVVELLELRATQLRGGGVASQAARRRGMLRAPRALSLR